MADKSEPTDQDIQRAVGHLAAIVESSDDAIVSKTLDGRIRSWNAGAQRLFGYPADEAIGQSITLIIPPELYAEEQQIIDNIRRGERVDHFDTIRLTRDGRRIPVSLTISPIRDARGDIVGASKIARDISERKQGEQAMREEARLLAALNQMARSLVEAQLDVARVAQVVADAGTTLSGAAFGACFYYVQNDREEWNTVYAVSGLPRAAFAGFSLPCDTAVFAPTLREQELVRSADITRDERYGRTAPYHGLPPGHPPVRSYMAVPVVSGARQVVGGLFLGHPQPGVFTQRSERIVVGIAAQAAVAFDNARLHQAAQREIAHRKRVEEALGEADRRKNEFLALLAHELRNPLAPIRYAVAMGHRHRRNAEQQRLTDEIIERQVGHMSRLLDDLLDVSRITHGTMELRRAQIDLASVVAVAVEAARPMLDARQHVLALDLPPVPVPLNADPVRLAQVFSNLLINAAKYTDAGGRIQLQARLEGHDILVTVRDNGIGIAPEMMPRLFTLFSQAQPALDRAEGGLGIGLAIVRGLVALHGGSVEARSAGIRRGSEFVVRLPGADVSPRALTAVDPPALPASGRRRSGAAALRLLVADDNEDAAQACAMLLQLSGHEVHVAHSGAQALELALRMRPQALLLDIGMPDFSGYELARRIRSTDWGRDAMLIAVTGWGQETDKRCSREAGFDHHLVKPIEPAQLEVLLDTIAAHMICDGSDAGGMDGAVAVARPAG